MSASHSQDAADDWGDRADDGDGDLDPTVSDGPDGPAAELVVPAIPVRLMSSLIDALVAVVGFFLLYVTAASVFVHPETGKDLTAAQQTEARWIQTGALVVVAVVLAYMHRTRMGSVGNRLSRIRLVDGAGRPASFGRLLAKYLVLFGVSLVPFGLIIVVLTVFVGPALQRERRNIFDQLTGLRPVMVVRD